MTTDPQSPTTLLDREEYVEQAYFFASLARRMQQNMATQEVMVSLREEILSSTKLPLAIDFLASDIRLHGVLAPAMARLAHYFTAFQTFVMGEAEREGGRFDFQVALEVLQRDAEFRAAGATSQGMFFFQFESLCRNRLGYDKGLEAIAKDPLYPADWREWILALRRQIGLIDFADLVYVRSAHYLWQRDKQGLPPDEMANRTPLFGEREGKIALAHRHKDPLLFFATLERQLGYPVVPRPKPIENPLDQIRLLQRRMERLESRLRLVEDESRTGIDITKFYGQQPVEPPDDLAGGI